MKAEDLLPRTMYLCLLMYNFRVFPDLFIHKNPDLEELTPAAAFHLTTRVTSGEIILIGEMEWHFSSACILIRLLDIHLGDLVVPLENVNNLGRVKEW